MTTIYQAVHVVCLAILLRGTLVAQVESPPPVVCGESKFVFASKEEATKFLGTPDAFVDALSPFDRQARLKTGETVDRERYLQFCSQQALAWTDQEVATLTTDLQSIAEKLSRFQLSLPDRVLLIKTTGLEEGGAAYTRGPAIILPQRRMSGGQKSQEGLLLHELFHVLSRHDADTREQLYAIIGYRKCGEMQWTADMRDLKLTNPDGPFNNHCIQVTHDGASHWAIPILFSQSAYDATKGGEFFQYMTFKLILIAPPADDTPAQPQLANGKPILLDPKATEGFMSQIGNNTGYIIHPDEVLADNFVLLVLNRQGVPTPDVLTKMAAVLKEKK